VERADSYMPPLLEWGDIGYNFLVGEDGNVYEGRGWTQVGAQTLNSNSKSIGIDRLCVSHSFYTIYYILGISVVGDYTYRLPNDAALIAVKQLIKCGVSRGFIKSDYLLRGHKY
jgi:peptidoglycan recognition protein